MAMLSCPMFLSRRGRRDQPFWSIATKAAREKFRFLFTAEVLLLGHEVHAPARRV